MRIRQVFVATTNVDLFDGPLRHHRVTLQLLPYLNYKLFTDFFFSIDVVNFMFLLEIVSELLYLCSSKNSNSFIKLKFKCTFYRELLYYRYILKDLFVRC